MSAREAEMKVRALLEEEPEALDQALEMVRGGTWRWEGCELVDQQRRGTIPALVAAARGRVKHHVEARMLMEAAATDEETRLLAEEGEAVDIEGANVDPATYLADPDLGGTPVADVEVEE